VNKPDILSDLFFSATAIAASFNLAASIAAVNPNWSAAALALELN
jgi:hypothetical protein